MKKIYFLIVLVVFQANAMEVPRDKASSEFSLEDVEEGKIPALKDIHKELAAINKTLKENNGIVLLTSTIKSFVFVATCLSVTFILSSKLS